MCARVQRNTREPSCAGSVPGRKGGRLFAGPVEFSTGEIALLLAIVLAPSLLLGVVGAWFVARRRPAGGRWPWAILGFLGGLVLGLSIQWFGTAVL